MSQKIIKLFSTITSLFVISIILTFPLTAQDEDVISVKVGEDEGIREIAEKYLNNPDLWVDILRANNIETAADLKVGMILRIPVKSISRASVELEKSKEAIQKADQSGAKIFALALIDSAVSSRNKALEQRQKGLWDDCYQLANSALKSADQAYEICMSKKNVAGNAVVHYRLGTVQNRKIIDLIWNDAPKGTTLEEREKVRTLTKSYAEILFKDESRMRLEENSQAVIQEMRVNLLENKTKSKISLIEGDFLALLASSGSAQNFEVDIRGVETEIKSTKFRIGKDEQEARFANYEGEMGITAQGSKVVLQKNQGSIVKKDEKPTKPKDLLPKVKLSSPQNGEELFTLDTKFSVDELRGAEIYRFEVAKDKLFSNIVFNEKISKPFIDRLPPLESGAYYWRVSGIDKSNLSGPYSNVNSFTIVKDDEPPYLTLKSPLENEILLDSLVTFKGETENEASVVINGNPAVMNEKAGFTAEVPLVEGKNVILIEAFDKGKNKTVIERTVTYQPAGKGMLVFSENLVQAEPNHFLVRNSAITLSGETDPGNIINIRSKAGTFSAKCNVKNDGLFGFNILLQEKVEQFEMSMTSTAREKFVNNITVEIDDTPPEIIFSERIPAVTSDTLVIVSGEIKDGHKLTIDGSEIDLAGGKFRAEIQVKSGENSILFTAYDKAGNETRMEQKIRMDNKPPKLIKYSITPNRVKGGEIVQISVHATDDSGLKKAASFTIQVADFTFNGFLRYKKSEKRYEGTVTIPAGKSGTISLKKIILEDSQGNSKEINY